MDDIACRQAILSEEFADFMITYGPAILQYVTYFEGEICLQEFSPRFTFLHIPLSEVGDYLQLPDFIYSAVPHLYTLLDTTSMEASGIIRAQNNPALRLTGQGVIIGLIDTGIDYQNSLFRDRGGRSRITRIWDQTIQEGAPPTGFLYGTEYTGEDIDRALVSETPLGIVPSTDTNGHGTFMAGIAAGGEDEEGQFIGAAPESEIAVVKLKPAKTYLRNFNFIKEDAVAYQETDILMAVKYFAKLREDTGKPVVIYLGIGTNQGYHGGFSVLDAYLNQTAVKNGIVAVAAVGNETNRAHHFHGTSGVRSSFGPDAGGRQAEAETVEIRVPEGERGFALELWANIPETYSVGFISPTGEEIARIPARIGQSARVDFLLEETILYVDYQLVEFATGRQLILMRFDRPAAGIWKILVYNRNFITGQYDMWLPVTGFLEPDTVFLRPDPNITLTAPSPAVNVITVGGYNHVDGSLYLHSGRGYSSAGAIKPELVAPAVNVYGPGLRGNYVRKTGTSVAAAHVAGASAGLLQWGIVNGNSPFMESNSVKAYLIRGAGRKPNITYPNPEWGYGTLDLYHVFEEIRE